MTGKQQHHWNSIQALAEFHRDVCGERCDSFKTHWYVFLTKTWNGTTFGLHRSIHLSVLQLKQTWKNRRHKTKIWKLLWWRSRTSFDIKLGISELFSIDSKQLTWRLTYITSIQLLVYFTWKLMVQKLRGYLLHFIKEQRTRTVKTTVSHSKSIIASVSNNTISVKD